jgi:hypothetical protein
MSHGPYRFRESEMRRAIKAARSAGIRIGRVELNKDGTIVVVPGEPSDVSGDALNPWDEILANATDKERTS